MSDDATAIELVLRAERDAREAVAAAQAEVTHIAELARAQARAVAQRSERRLLRVAACFAQDLAARLAQFEAEAAALASAAQAGVRADAPLPALDAAVLALAHELLDATRDERA
jgi:hypothetical protein